MLSKVGQRVEIIIERNWRQILFKKEIMYLFKVSFLQRDI